MIPLLLLFLNLNVAPVLAEPKEGVVSKAEAGVFSPKTTTKRHGEARENTTKPTVGDDITDSRGDVQTISPAEMWVRLMEEYQPWTPPNQPLPGNSFAARMKHDPQ